LGFAIVTERSAHHPLAHVGERLGNHPERPGVQGHADGEEHGSKTVGGLALVNAHLVCHSLNQIHCHSPS
jgi:hypothetical protein